MEERIEIEIFGRVWGLKKFEKRIHDDIHRRGGGLNYHIICENSTRTETHW